jgi:hypothetical protein
MQSKLIYYYNQVKNYFKINQKFITMSSTNNAKIVTLVDEFGRDYSLRKFVTINVQDEFGRDLSFRVANRSFISEPKKVAVAAVETLTPAVESLIPAFERLALDERFAKFKYMSWAEISDEIDEEQENELAKKDAERKVLSKKSPDYELEDGEIFE